MNHKLKQLIKEQACDKWHRVIIPYIIRPLKKTTSFKLTVRQKAFLTLKMCGFTHEEIAQAFGTTRVNVKVTLHKIKRKLGMENYYRIP